MAKVFSYAKALGVDFARRCFKHSLKDLSKRFRYSTFLDNETVEEIILLATVDYPCDRGSNWQFRRRSSPANGVDVVIGIVSVQVFG